MFVVTSPMPGDATLRVGFADGRVTFQGPLHQIAPLRWSAIAPMTSGRMAYAISDPDLTEIHVVDAATGGESTVEIADSPLILALALAPDGRTAYFVGRARVPPTEPGHSDLGPSTGVWSVDLGGNGAPVRILAPGAPTSTFSYWQDPEHIQTQVSVTADGATVVAATFVGVGPVRIQELDLATGAVADTSTPLIVMPLGISGRMLVGLGEPGDTSPLAVLDLDSGVARQVAGIEAAEAAVQRLAPIGAYIDNVLRRAGQTELQIIDLRSGAHQIVYRNAQRAYWPGWTARIEPPPDWIFLTPEGCFPPSPDNFGALLNWRTGELVPLGMEEAPPGPCNG